MYVNLHGISGGHSTNRSVGLSIINITSLKGGVLDRFFFPEFLTFQPHLISRAEGILTDSDKTRLTAGPVGQRTGRFWNEQADFVIKQGWATIPGKGKPGKGL